jgi:hypothetical protein
VAGATDRLTTSPSAPRRRLIAALIPERLYGRDREIETLLAASDRVVVGCRPLAFAREIRAPLFQPRVAMEAFRFAVGLLDLAAQLFQIPLRVVVERSGVRSGTRRLRRFQKKAELDRRSRPANQVTPANQVH